MAAEVTAYIAVGSNIDPEANIPAALDLLAARVRITGVSTFFRTAPIGRPEQGAYLNGMMRVECGIAARALKFEVLRGIESALGRVRSADKYAAREIDLDLALFGDAVIEEEDLQVPERDLRARPFLAAALAELAPELRMPDTGETVSALFTQMQYNELEPAWEFTQRLRERFGS